MSGTITDALNWWARTKPDLIAIDYEGDEVSYRELNGWADGVGADLRTAGVQRGDRVSLVAANSLDWCLAALGAWKIGAIVAPFNQRLVTRELVALVEDCRPTVVYCDETTQTELESVHAAVGGFAIKRLESDVGSLRHVSHAPIANGAANLDEPTSIVYTSGTAGQPKGVIFTHRSIAGEIYEWGLIEDVGPNGLRVLFVLPLFTAAGVVWGIARVILHGGTFLLASRFDPAKALEVLATKQVTTFTGPPILFEQIAARPEFAEADLSTLTSPLVGGARVPSDLLRQWHAQGVILRQIYGQTEIGGCATAMPAEEALAHPEQCGWGGIFTKLRVVDENDNDVPAGIEGQILLRGPGMTPGYWGNEEATRAAIRDGWLHTGDVGRLDERGYLTFVDRQKDLIISGGLNISPLEVEMVVGAMSGVVEVAVISVPDAKFGETPAVLLRTSASISADEVVAWCNERLADFKVPRYVVFVEEPFPRIGHSKLDKRALSQTYATIPQTHPKVR